MPNEKEIIDFMKKSKANEPDTFRQYMEYYKTNHPDFYKTKLAPYFDEKKPAPVAAVKSKKAPVNPADELMSDLSPIGSANVGEELKIENKEENSKFSATQTENKPAPTVEELMKRDGDGKAGSERQAMPAVAETPANTTIKRKDNKLKLILIIAGVLIALAATGAVAYLFLLA